MLISLCFVSCQEVSDHFEYPENLLFGLDIICQPIREDLTETPQLLLITHLYQNQSSLLHENASHV